MRDARTNRRIRAREVRVIGPEGEQLGVLQIEAALSKAAEFGLDLVEVSPMAKPPVCKIMDYGKHKYQEKKRANEAKKKQTIVKLKEIKFRPKTEEHDYQFKVRQVREFLEEGNKARITVMFRGREITHREIGQNILKRVETDLKDIAITEQPSRLEGRLLFMIIAPNPRWLQAQKSRAEAAERAPAKQAAAPAAPAASAPSSSASAASTGASAANGAPKAAVPAPPPVASGAASLAQVRAEAPKA
ncbi:MAG TPA: translation initiation factor IF-3 [Myxococcales bacterium]|nr:translation initiation factor IF-3 [Myxococcales bacterium]